LSFRASATTTHAASMFHFGFLELVLIVVVGLLFVGPKQLPEGAKTVSKAIGKLRRTADELRDSARQVVEEVIPPEDLYGYGADESKKIAPPAMTVPKLPSPEEDKKNYEDDGTPNAGGSDL